jgi:hypothetical protein
MTDIVEQARKVVELHGDTYSSYEVVGLLGQLVAEIERARQEGNKLAEENIELCVKLREAAAKIERLRAENKSLAEKAIKALEMWRDAKP